MDRRQNDNVDAGNNDPENGRHDFDRSSSVSIGAAAGAASAADDDDDDRPKKQHHDEPFDPTSTNSG
jgi:hypothetical protein